VAKIEFTPRADAVFPSEDAPGVVDAAFSDCKPAKHSAEVEAEVDRLLGILPVALAVLAAVCA